MSYPTIVTVTVNGSRVEYRTGSTVDDLVTERGWHDEALAVAVAVDGAVVPRGRWHSTALIEGNDVITLSPMQGG